MFFWAVFRLAVFPDVFCAPSVIKRVPRCLLHGNNSMAKHGSDSPCASSAKKKYAAKYKPEWATDLQFIIICHSDKGPTFAYCSVQYAHKRSARWQEQHCSPCKFGQLLYVAESHIIAHSNADSERVFSLRALLSCKINTDDPCYFFVPEKDLLKSATVATWDYVKVVCCACSVRSTWTLFFSGRFVICVWVFIIGVCLSCMVKSSYPACSM